MLPMATCLLACLTVSVVQAQSFEVNVIKPHDPKAACEGSNLLPGGRFVATCWPLKELIQEAYDILPSQISGGPAWIRTDLWDITAKADGIVGEIPYAQFRLMLRKLIGDEFQLSLRTETKVLPVFALVVARKGPKSRTNLMPNAGAPYQWDFKSGPVLICRKVTMTQLASWLKVFLFARRPVLDKTGLAGEYDFTLQWRPEPAQESRDGGGDSLPAPNASGQALMTALREQLGLQLESQKAPTSVFVIERAEHPVSN